MHTCRLTLFFAVRVHVCAKGIASMSTEAMQLWLTAPGQSLQGEDARRKARFVTVCDEWTSDVHRKAFVEEMLLESFA